MSVSKVLAGFPALAVALVFAFSSGAIAAGDAHHHDNAAGGATLVLNQGKKWQTDDVARQGMERLRSALAADLKAIHGGKQTASQYQALATKVNAEIANMVQNCKLDPKTDEQFHRVIAELLAGAEAMQGKDKAVAPRRGAERMATALDAYGRHFEHPGWRRL